MQQGVLDLIYQNVGIVRNKPILASLRDGSWTNYKFEDVQRSAQHLSNHLIESGISPGERIAFFADPCPELGVVFFAAVRAGAIFVPIDPKLSQKDLQAVVDDAQPILIFCSSDRYEFLSNCGFGDRLIIIDNVGSSDDVDSLETFSTHILQEGVERELTEAAVISYTSGSSGPIKGVMVSFENLLYQTEQAKFLLEGGRRDNVLALQSNVIADLVFGFLGTICSGGQVCYVGKTSPAKVVKTIRNRKLSGVVLSAPMVADLKKEVELALLKTSRQQQIQFKMRFGLAKLLPHRNRKPLFPVVNQILGWRFKTIITCGDSVDLEAAAFFDTVGIDVCNGYGSVETSGPVTSNTHQNSKIHSAGKALGDIELDLLGAKFVGDEGEIITRGPHVMKGYYKRDELTRVALDGDGWYYTGDLGKFDEDGYLYVTGSIRDVISHPNGFKFHPELVESVLQASNTVREVCVLGLRKAQSFEHEEVVAIVVPARNTTRANLLKALNSRLDELPAYQRPNRIVVHSDSLPKTSSGKVKRWALIEWLKIHKPAELR